MHALVKFFVRFPIAGDLLMILLFAAGVFGLVNMRSTFFPEVESRLITIQTVLPGASPEEIEEGIILKIEENIKGVTGVERVSSVSQENAGVITVEALKGFDTEKVLDDVVFIRDGGIFLNDSVDNIRTNYKKSVDELFREVFACC